MLRQPDQNLTQEPLIEDDFVVVAPATHPLARKKRPTIEDLAGERWVMSPADTVIRRRLDEFFAARGLPTPVPAAEISPALLKLRVAAKAELLCFQSARWLDENPVGVPLVRIAVPEITQRRRIGVLYRKHAYLSPAARRFLDVLRATARDLDGETPVHRR